MDMDLCLSVNATLKCVNVQASAACTDKTYLKCVKCIFSGVQMSSPLS